MSEEHELLPIFPAVSDGGPCDQLAAALAAFQAEAPAVAKTKIAKAGSYSYSYADLAAVAAAAYPLLAKHGLAFTAAPQRDVLVGKLLHTSGQWDYGTIMITGRTMQELGSAISYGRRYLVSSLTGIVTDDDDDGQAASSRPAQQQPKPEPRKPAAKKPAETGELLTDAQMKKLQIGFKEAGLDRAAAHAYAMSIIGHDLESSKDLTRSEASKVIDALAKDAETDKAADQEPELRYGGTDPWNEAMAQKSRGPKYTGD